MISVFNATTFLITFTIITTKFIFILHLYLINWNQFLITFLITFA